MDAVGTSLGGAFQLFGRFAPRFASCRGFEDTTVEYWGSKDDLKSRFGPSRHGAAGASRDTNP